MVGTWQYRAYYMYQAGCWPEGGGTVCMLDSTLEAIDGTVVLGPARDSSFGATYKSWKIPYHLEITIRQWDVLGACNGAPLSCFTARAPTATGTDIRDSIFEIGQDASLPAGIMLRDGHAQWYWTTAVVHPTRLYDSVAAVAPPAHPGVHELQKQP
ncbi:MAG TPA: hypothetical protein VKC57_09050 [Ktedonobacterales bacterium]|nr:hypothetical protein [Ktedonobacterales bacterium]